MQKHHGILCNLTVYESVAECLPDEPMVVDTANPFEHIEPTVVQEIDAFNRAVQSCGALGSSNPALLVPSANLPKKFLPPGCPKDYWWTFKATVSYPAAPASVGAAEVPAPGSADPVPPSGCKRVNTGSYSTFKRVWGQCFKSIMAFRAWGTHACCNTCAELSSKIRLAASLADKLRFAEAKRQHLQQQWRDRLVYWRLRSASQSQNGDWITATPSAFGFV